MNQAQRLIDEVGQYGKRVVRISADTLRLTGPGTIPDWLKDAIREQKPAILEELAKQEPPPSTWIVPNPDRAGHPPEMVGTMFMHWCCRCGAWGSCGVGFDPKRRDLGRWYCATHAPEGGGA